MAHDIDESHIDGAYRGRWFRVSEDGDSSLVVFHDDMITIPVDIGASGRHVFIRGEDLYAFRELLAELPEEAFVRPADPVAESYSLRDGSGDWWAFNGTHWWCISHEPDLGPENLEQYESGYPDLDEGAAKVFAHHGVYEEPTWTDGDVVTRNDIDGRAVWVRENGAFQLVYADKPDAWFTPLRDQIADWIVSEACPDGQVLLRQYLTN